MLVVVHDDITINLNIYVQNTVKLFANLNNTLGYSHGDIDLLINEIYNVANVVINVNILNKIWLNTHF